MVSDISDYKRLSHMIGKTDEHPPKIRILISGENAPVFIIL